MLTELEVVSLDKGEDGKGLLQARQRGLGRENHVMVLEVGALWGNASGIMGFSV